MSVHELPGSPGDHCLESGEGVELAAFFRRTDKEGDWATHFRVQGASPPALVCDAVMAAMAGWRITVDDARLAAALASRGAEVGRAARMMTLEAERGVLPRPGVGKATSWPLKFRITPIDRPAADLVPSLLAATPPGHPDHLAGQPQEQRCLAELESVLAGEYAGPLIPSASALLVDHDDDVLGAILVTLWGDSKLPFVVHLFRTPGRAAAGGGRALLGHASAAVAAAGGLSLSLLVTEGNTAIKLYEEVGFVTRRRTQNLRVPAAVSA